MARTPEAARPPTTEAAGPTSIRLVAGLGNPEPRYSGTRHNAGQMVDTRHRRIGDVDHIRARVGEERRARQQFVSRESARRVHFY